MRRNLAVAEQQPQKTDLDRKAYIRRTRTMLLDASVGFILEGTEGTIKDRLREASEASGIPLNTLEIETKRQAR